jgi:hypothetical protein
VRARVAAAALAVVAVVAAVCPAARAAEPRSLVGAVAPPLGGVVFSGEAGMIFVLPTLSVAANVGLGGGASAEIRYRNIAGLGHAGKLRLALSKRVHRYLVFGVAVHSSITSLAQADIDLLGIQFSNLSIGNDWLAGGALSLTWLRPRHAHVTASIGPTFTLGGLRYTSYTERAFRIDPAPRALTGTVQGEWEIRPRFNVFLRLDADVLLQQRIMPLGFIPTGTVGFGWAV